MTSRWTDVDELVAVLRRRWQDGRYAAAYAAGAAWAPVSLPVKGPTAAELLEHFDEAQRWAERFHRDSRTRGGAIRFRVEYLTVKGRNLGANQTPARIWVDSLDQLGALLGTTSELRALDAIIDQTRTCLPAALPWVVDHPLRAVEHVEVWARALATVAWIAAHGTEPIYLRQVDVEGVDTKFVERHRALLDDLLSTAW
ncbi:MAG: DUF3322 domain-containing protein [Acidimicrobiales bacterium]